MWEQLLVLARGRRYEAVEAVTDRHAFAILPQQIREAAASLEQAQVAVAVAMAQEREEGRRAADLSLRIEDLETRAVEALEGDKPELAQAAAEAIGAIEADLSAAGRTRAMLACEIERLRRTLADAQARLRDLRRGQRIAEAAGRVGRLRHTAPGEVGSTLRDAEATLQRLRDRQTETVAVHQALDELNAATDAQTLSRRLADAGCGAPHPHSAEAVLERLRQRRRTAGG